MERLTDKETKTLKYSEENNITLSNSRIEAGKRKSYFYGKPIEKLAEFEDFMEEQGFKNLEDFKKALEIKLPDERVKQIALEEMRKEMKNHIAQILKKEVPELYKYKDRWQKLKDFCDMLLKEYKEDDDDIDYCVGKTIATKKVLDKMKKLEKEIK